MTNVYLDRKISINLPNACVYEFQRKIAKVYKQEKEKTLCEKRMNTLSKDFLHQFKQTPFYKDDYQMLISDATEYSQHHAYQLQNSDQSEITLHILPKNSEVLIFSNTDRFNLTLIDSGTISVKKYTKKTSTDSFIQLLYNGDTQIELPQSKSYQRLKALSDIAIYLRIKIKVRLPQYKVLSGMWA